MNLIKEHYIFLFDAIGAFISMICLSILSVFHMWIGLPQSILYRFVSIAIFCFLFSCIVYFLKPVNWKKLVWIIALINTLYTIYTLIELIQHRSHLTLYGYSYFAGELLILFALIVIEIKIART